MRGRGLANHFFIDLETNGYHSGAESCCGFSQRAKTSTAARRARVPAPLLTELGDRWLSGQKQQTVNLPAFVVYGGSNPPLSIRA